MDLDRKYRKLYEEESKKYDDMETDEEIKYKKKE